MEQYDNFWSNVYLHLDKLVQSEIEIDIDPYFINRVYQ